VSFFGWLAWLWRTRTCVHGRVRPIHGDERNYGYRYRCLDCDKPLHTEPSTEEAPDA
jgi:hypothetical protein